MPPARARVLLIEPDAGNTVEKPPKGADVVAFAEQSHPQVMVLGIHGNASPVWHILDQLQANPHTRDIPIVVVSTSPRIAAQAKASPQARDTVIGPYNCYRRD